MSDATSYLVIDAKRLDDDETFEHAIGPAWKCVVRLLQKQIQAGGGFADVVAVKITATARTAAELVEPKL